MDMDILFAYLYLHIDLLQPMAKKEYMYTTIKSRYSVNSGVT